LLARGALGEVQRQNGDDGLVGRSSDWFGRIARDSIDGRHDWRCESKIVGSYRRWRSCRRNKGGTEAVEARVEEE
jgi:hypothetical protein